MLVIGYRCDELPAFYARSSGLALDHRSDDVAEVAAICHARWHGLDGGGVLVCNPIPKEAALALDAPIAAALADAVRTGVTGKRLTPYLLARLAEVTDGASIRANRALAMNDARLAGALALALAPH